MEEEKTRNLKVILSAKRDARNRLLDALNEFDPAEDKEKVEKIKNTLIQIDKEIKELKAEKASSIPEKSIQEIDSSKNALQLEMEKLKENISCERESWGQKLITKQREINLLKTKMNLRQAELRAEYQIKKQELEKIRDSLEGKLKREIAKDTSFEDERQRWVKRLAEKQQVIDELKVNLADKASDFHNQLSELKDDYSVKLAVLEEENSILRQQKIREYEKLNREIASKQHEIIELQQLLNLESSKYQQEIQLQKNNHMLEIESMKDTLKDEKESVVREREKIEGGLKNNITDKENAIRDLKEKVASLNEINKNLEYEKEKEIKDLKEEQKENQQAYEQKITNLNQVVNELKNVIADRQRHYTIQLNNLEKDKEIVVAKLNQIKLELEDAKNEVVLKVKENERLKEEKDRKIINLNKDIENLKDSLANADKKYENLRIHKEDIEDGFEIRLENEIEIRRIIEDGLNDSIKEKNNKVRELEANIFNLNESKNSLKILLEEEINSLKNKSLLNIKEKDMEIEELKAQGAKLSADFSLECKVREDENKAWGEKLCYKESKINELLHNLQIKSVCVENLEKDLNQQRIKNEELKSSWIEEVLTLKDEIAGIEQQYSGTLSGLNERLKSLKNEKDKLVEEYTSKLQKQNQELEDKKLENKLLKQEHGKEKENILLNLRDADERYEKVKIELYSTIEQFKDGDRESKSLLIKYGNSKIEMQKLEEEIKKLKIEKDEISSILKKENNNIKSRFSIEKSRLSHDIEDVKDNLARKTWEVNKVREELNNLLKEFEERVAAQRKVWEEKLRNKEEQIKSIREERDVTKNSLGERLEELKDANWRMQVQLEEDRKNWRKESQEKEVEYKNLKINKEKREKELVEELANRESKWLQEKGALERKINKIESIMNSELPRRKDDISKLRQEVGESLKQLEMERAAHKSDVQEIKDDMKRHVSELDSGSKKLEEENIKLRSDISEKESALITQKSKLENDLAILENRYDSKIAQLHEEIKNYKTENSEFKAQLLNKSDLLDREKTEKKDELSELRHRLEKNIENFKLNIDEVSVEKEKLKEKDVVLDINAGPDEIKEKLKECKNLRRDEIREKETEYRNAASKVEKDRIREELLDIEKKWKEKERILRMQLKEKG